MVNCRHLLWSNEIKQHYCHQAVWYLIINSRESCLVWNLLFPVTEPSHEQKNPSLNSCCSQNVSFNSQISRFIETDNLPYLCSVQCSVVWQTVSLSLYLKESSLLFWVTVCTCLTCRDVWQVHSTPLMLEGCGILLKKKAKFWVSVNSLKMWTWSHKMLNMNVETKVFSYRMCICISIAFLQGFHHATSKPKLGSTSLLYESACELFIK